MKFLLTVNAATILVHSKTELFKRLSSLFSQSGWSSLSISRVK